MDDKRRALIESIFAPRQPGPRYVGPTPEPEEEGYEPPQEIALFFPAGADLPRAGFAVTRTDPSGRMIEVSVHEILEIKWNYVLKNYLTGIKVLVKGYEREVEA